MLSLFGYNFFDTNLSFKKYSFALKGVHNAEFIPPVHGLPTLRNLHKDNGKRPLRCWREIAVYCSKENKEKPCSTEQIADFSVNTYSFFKTYFYPSKIVNSFRYILTLN